MNKSNKEKGDIILRNILFFHFKNNTVFKFNDFVSKVKETDFKQVYFTYEVIKCFIYEMIDNKIIAQIYVNENENPFVDESNTTSSSNVIIKSIHFKLIVAEHEN